MYESDYMKLFINHSLQEDLLNEIINVKDVNSLTFE